MAYSQFIFPKMFPAPQAVCAGYSSQLTMSGDSDWPEELLAITFFVIKLFAFLAIVLWPWEVAK